MADLGLEKLARWWWSLSEERREEIRDEWLEKYASDPEFHARVNKMLTDYENERLR